MLLDVGNVMIRYVTLMIMMMKMFMMMDDDGEGDVSILATCESHE